MIVTMDTFLELSPIIERLALLKDPESPDEWIKKHFFVTTTKSFSSGKLLWQTISQVCMPAKDVTFFPYEIDGENPKICPYRSYGRNRDHIATREELGTSNLIEYDIIDTKCIRKLRTRVSDLRIEVERSLILLREESPSFLEFHKWLSPNRKVSTTYNRYIPDLQYFENIISVLERFTEENFVDVKMQIEQIKRAREVYVNWLESTYGEKAPIVKRDGMRPLFFYDTLRLDDGTDIYRDAETGKLKVVPPRLQVL